MKLYPYKARVRAAYGHAHKMKKKFKLIEDNALQVKQMHVRNKREKQK